MVQVDIIWSYAFGASFAAAATNQLQHEEKAFDNRFYARLMLFLGAFFAPSGLFLLWQFPQWETMQVARTHTDIPSWLVTLFGVTNVTQGILGYYVSYRFSRAGKHHASHANWMISWILFWFVLVAGWDLTGWQRFLYDRTMNQGEFWQPGMHMGPRFFLGEVFQSLVLMAACFLPMLRYGIIAPMAEGLQARGSDTKKWRLQARLAAAFYALSFGAMLSLAIIAYFIVKASVQALASNLWGYVVGLGLTSVIYYLGLFRRGMPLHRIAGLLFGHDLKPLVAEKSIAYNRKSHSA